jgi:sulfonate dioxygenase
MSDLRMDTIRMSTSSTIATPSLQESTYRYAHLLPHFSAGRYPPLTPFVHVDPALRALSHDNPRAFLDNATSVRELTPYLGTEVTGINLAELDSPGRDQLALEVHPPSQDSLLSD